MDILDIILLVFLAGLAVFVLFFNKPKKQVVTFLMMLANPHTGQIIVYPRSEEFVDFLENYGKLEKVSDNAYMLTISDGDDKLTRYADALYDIVNHTHVE